MMIQIQCIFNNVIIDSVSKLMHTLKQMDFPGSFPAQKLKTPYGYPVCAVLDFLCDTALTLKNFKLPSKLIIQDEEEAKMETLLDDTDENVEIADDLEYDDAPLYIYTILYIYNNIFIFI